MHYFKCRTSAASHSRNELLGYNGFEHVSKLGSDLLLLMRRKYVNDTVHGGRGTYSMQCRKYKVACFGCGYGSTYRLKVTHLSHKDYVGIFT